MVCFLFFGLVLVSFLLLFFIVIFWFSGFGFRFVVSLALLSPPPPKKNKGGEEKKGSFVF